MRPFLYCFFQPIVFSPLSIYYFCIFSIGIDLYKCLSESLFSVICLFLLSKMFLNYESFKLLLAKSTIFCLAISS